jgi:hypothetical protein
MPKIGNILNLEDCNIEQLNFIKSDLQDCCLIGIPGGGKTTTIIKKILFHISEKKIGSKEFLIITFSKKACYDFISRGEDINKDIFTKSNVKTLHSLAGTIVNKLDKSKSESIEIVICKALNYIESYDEIELKKIKCLKDLKLIIIDEAQDISEIQYNLAKKISDKFECTLILVGDPNQNIYQFQNGTDKFLLEHSKNKYYLKQNYRSTPEIINLINDMKPWKHLVPDIIPTRKSLNRKPIVYSSSLNSIVEHMKETIDDWKKEGIDMKDIGIIGPVKKSKENNFGKFNNIGLQYFVNYFEDNKIPYIKHYTETTSDCEVVNTNSYQKDGHINLYTIHGSKGLEFKKVFLLNFHTNTYGRNPTFKDYNNFRYLWYVGLSRARDDIIIYCDSNKNVWYELAKCNQQYYKFMGKQIKFIEPIFEKNIKRSSAITELLKTKEIFSEEFIVELKDYLNLQIQEEDIFNKINPLDFDEYSSLYGKFIEQIFEYYYCKKNNKKYMLSQMTKQFINNRISLGKKFQPYLHSFLSKVSHSPISLIELQFINEIKNDFDDHEKEIYEEILIQLNEKNIESFSIYIPNELIYDNPTEILEIVNKIEKEDDINYNLFLLNLYFYQYEHEAKYLFKQKDNIWDKFKIIEINKIKEYVEILIDTDIEFQIPITSKYLENFSGMIDCYDKQNKNIIEIKFTKNTSLIHYLQVFFYNFVKNHSIDKLENMSIINLLEGKKYTITINKNIDSFTLLLKLAKNLKSKINNLVICYDLETTGLIEDDYPEIIDRYFYEINLNSVIDSGLVIPEKKLSNEIIELTHINEEMLKQGIKHKEFIEKFKELNNYFEYPTYIAHNGHHFDHKIMCHYALDYNKVKFMDSRQLIINFTKEKGKLTELYNKITGKVPLIAHRAEADVKMMIEIIKKIDLNIKMNF